MKFVLSMDASKNSETCLPRGHCYPIGGNSVWSTFSKKIDPDDGKKIVIVSSQLDGNSLFHEFSTGLNSQISGLVANLGIANAFSKLDISPDEFQNHIIFTFFSGESYGYAGSQRFVQDISTPFKCNDHESKDYCNNYSACTNPCIINDDFKNLNINNIKGIVELNQLACQGCKNNLNYYIHVDDTNNQGNKELVNLILNAANANNQSQLITNGTGEFNDANSNDHANNTNIRKKREGKPFNYNIKPAYEGLNTNLGLPPSSAQSFLKKNRKIPAVVISDFQKEFTNEYYHSTWDTSIGEEYEEENLYNNSICKTANIIAKSLWLYAQNKNDINEIPTSLEVDCEYINDIMMCLTNNLEKCNLGSRIINSNLYSVANFTNNIKTYSHYSGIFNENSLKGSINSNNNVDTWFTYYSLFNITGIKTDQECKHIDNCTLIEFPDYDNLKGDEKYDIYNFIKPISTRKVQCIDGYCVKGQVYSHPAYGIGLNYDINNNLFTIVDSKKPTWTESK